MSKLSDLIDRGLNAAKAAAGVEGRMYYATDLGIWLRDSGAAWENCGGLMVYKGSFAYNDASPKTIVTLPAGTLILDVLAKVTTAFDGGITIDLGDDGDPDGFIANANFTKTLNAWNGGDVTARGAYLYDATTKALRKLYTAETAIKATIASPGTTGAADVWVVCAALA